MYSVADYMFYSYLCPSFKNLHNNNLLFRRFFGSPPTVIFASPWVVTWLPHYRGLSAANAFNCFLIARSYHLSTKKPYCLLIPPFFSCYFHSSFEIVPCASYSSRTLPNFKRYYTTIMCTVVEAMIPTSGNYEASVIVYFLHLFWYPRDVLKYQ